MAANGPGRPAPQDLIAELNHQINSPLAAIRNALYLAASRSDDAEVQRYLRLADEEISSIAQCLRATRRQASAAPLCVFRRAAA